MADNLPLIPEKGSECADVRPILRTVFRELDYLPPLITQVPPPVTNRIAGVGDRPALLAGEWIEKYKLECEEIWAQEGELKHQHARRISQQPLPNIYRLCEPHARVPAPAWRLEKGLIDREDLVPTIQQNAGRDGSLWIKNILNRSSCELLSPESGVHAGNQQQTRLHPYDDSHSLQTLSIGAVETRPPLPPPAPPPPLSEPDYILCVPPQLDFVNFTIGNLHTHSIRLVNVSKFEVRLSIRPPKRRELDVQICGARGLTVTSGAAAELRVHFRPTDVRAVRDTLLIRVSMGRNFIVPIACYMQPPVLHILIPSVTSSVLSCTPGEPGACRLLHGGDVLELGARLLGDVHCARIMLHCYAEHASFFMLTEDAWFTFSLDCITTRGSVIASPFVLWPAWWSGGGSVRGCAWCRADHAGLHAAALRVLSSTAVVRHLYVLADSLLFGPDHLTIIAQDKDYDILDDGEQACEYFVHLGTAFPNRSLSATVQLINHSPVVYSYYWIVRPWGVCSCWQDEEKADGSLGSEDDPDRLCVGAREARFIKHKSPTEYEERGTNAGLVRVEPTRGQIMPRSTCAQHVQVPDVGERLGVQRAVLMLILKNIPKESFPPGYEPMIISTEEVQSEPVPGVESVVREVCEVVCAQMEVWWEVIPVRFVIDPPVLPLYHSRRLNAVSLKLNVTQLFGCEGVRVTWEVDERLPELPPLLLSPEHSCRTSIALPLPSLPNHFPETDIIIMKAAGDDWKAQCSITRQCATRHPALSPQRTWLGVVAPGSHMFTTFQLLNDTYQHICWWAESYRWWGENVPSRACVGRSLPCDHCQELACSCGLLKPARGALERRHVAEICYEVNAPQCDGCVATLVQVRRTGADVAQVHGAPGTEARAALVAYRVLAPRLVLRLLPCSGDSDDCNCRGSGCKLDMGALGSKRGTAMLRPLEALTVGRRTCYRLHIVNTTPLPTAVHFDRNTVATDIMKVKFTPNDFSLRAYGQMEVRVVLEARQVCARRLFVYCAHVERAYKPLYLVVDTAIDGLKVSCEVPLGGDLNTDSFVIMRRTQKEDSASTMRKHKPSTAEEIFAAEERIRHVVRDNICHCPSELVYIPPVKPVRPLGDAEEQTPIEILWTPPELTRICKCMQCSKPMVPELSEPICLQFTAVPLRTVRTRTLHLRNESVVTARWSASVRRWPRRHVRTLAADQWSGDVSAPGVALQCAPAGGVLAARADVQLSVHVYADCWGLYYDQLLIQIENVEPIVLDVWVEAVGPALHLPLQPSHQLLDLTPSMWMSASDPERVLRVRNASRARLVVHAYCALDHEYPQDKFPLRLYLRSFDVQPRTCPCVTAFDYFGEESDVCSLEKDMDTGFDLYLGPDLGPQDTTHYKVTPEAAILAAGEAMDWQVTLSPPLHDGEVTPDVNLILRVQPVDYAGPCWHRPEPPPQVVRLRQSVRSGRLKLSCREVRVKVCALDLPYEDVLRIRKRFYALNVGNGVLELGVETEPPWCVVEEYMRVGGEGRVAVAATCGAGCYCHERVAMRHRTLALRLEPRSCVEMCVEVAVTTAEAWPVAAAAAAGPCQTPAYASHSLTTTLLHLFDDDNVLKTVPLVLELEYPILRVVPTVIDFGFVTDGDSKKSYFTVSHTSRTLTLDIAAHWMGGPEFQIWPPFLRIPPGGSANVYLQYTAVWRNAPLEGCALVSVCSGAGAGVVKGDAEDTGDVGDACAGAGRGVLARAAWCRAVVLVRAAPARDHKFHVTCHDHTDDQRLLPPALDPRRPSKLPGCQLADALLKYQ